MATRADVVRQRAANQGIVRLATRDLERFWRTLDLTRPAVARDALLEFMPTLTAAYGDTAAAVAADWYEDLREDAGASGTHRPVLAENVPTEVVEERTRFGARHLWTPTPDAFLPFLSTITAEYVLQPGWDTVTENAASDPAAGGWRRQTRPEACGFCRMLADRGAVYRDSTATFAAHGNCFCVAVPEFGDASNEVGAVQYVASQRQASEADRKRVREYVAANYA